MGINEQIAEAEHELNMLKSIRDRTTNDLRKLKVGDLVYEKGFYDNDMFELTILEIDMKTCRVEVIEYGIAGSKPKWYDANSLFMKDPNDEKSFVKIGGL